MIGLLLSADAENLDTAPNAYYVVMTLDSLNLVIPQTHVYALEPILDVSYSEETAVGTIRVETITCNVYCLSENLTPLNVIPKHRRICVLLHTASPISGIDIQDFFVMPAISETMDHLPPNLFGILCDEVVLAEWTNTAKIFPLPICMQTPQTRLKGLMLQNNEVLCITTAQDLMNGCSELSNLKQEVL